MASTSEVHVPLESLTTARPLTIALVGNPNSGKSTVFNRLTGLRQKTANFPGVTVEKRVGKLTLDGTVMDLIDLPGTYSLSSNSDDERAAVDVLLGRIPGTPEPDVILAVVDATRLYQGLYLVQQLAELGRPMVIALTMTDTAIDKNIRVDTEALSQKLGGIPACKIVATTGSGLPQLKEHIAAAAKQEAAAADSFWPALRHAATSLRGEASDSSLSIAEIERALIDADSQALESLHESIGSNASTRIAELRESICGDDPPLAVEARKRYAWIVEMLPGIETKAGATARWGNKLTTWLNQPLPATAMFLIVMATIFQAVFAWATPLMDLIDGAAGGMGAWIESLLPVGMLTSFLVDGVIAGVGSVIIFLPQILILFLFIIILEDTGYLARAAFLVDRAMRSVGLSGQSVIPLLSGFACAVPGIMATRVIPNRRDRIATIIAAPFMTCSARLPVYALLIAAFVPERSYGFINLHGLVLFGLYMLGIVGGVATALLLKRSALRGPTPTFILALPEFHVPDLQTVLMKLLDRARVFLRRAGTVIFTVAVIIWALAYFPRSDLVETQRLNAETQAVQVLQGDALDAAIEQIENDAAAAHLSQSWLGRAGQFVEPLFTPLGWDWRISAAVIAGFPAREVVVAVLGTIYAVGAAADEASLSDRLTSATWPDGQLVFTLPMVLGLLVFYAWCLQCAATLAVIKRETNGWGWPLFAWSYMTGLGYFGALLIFQLGSA
ncbi:MAG: ferrous iron transport protein B [Candidatus Rariloculaceae bacterium]